MNQFKHRTGFRQVYSAIRGWQIVDGDELLLTCRPISGWQLNVALRAEIRPSPSATKPGQKKSKPDLIPAIGSTWKVHHLTLCLSQLATYQAIVQPSGMLAAKDRHYVIDIQSAILNRVELDSRKLEIPGPNRLDIDPGKPIDAILSCGINSTGRVRWDMFWRWIG